MTAINIVESKYRCSEIYTVLDIPVSVVISKYSQIAGKIVIDHGRFIAVSIKQNRSISKTDRTVIGIAMKISFIFKLWRTVNKTVAIQTIRHCVKNPVIPTISLHSLLEPLT